MKMEEEGVLLLQDHINIGNSLRIASDKLTKKLSRIKPKIKARKSKEAKAIKLIDRLRDLLEDIMFEDYGNEGDKKFINKTWWQDVYYGNTERRRETIYF